MSAKLADRFEFERVLWQQKVARVAGVDEAGRGPLAGPVVAAAAILPSRWAETGLPAELAGLNDSKQLTPAERDLWFDRIRTGAVAVSVCRAFPRRIDHRGLHKSNKSLLGQAVTRLPVQPDFALMDGFAPRTMRLPHLSIRKGDMVSWTVAAASVVAKVTRDRIMDRYHRRFPQYGFDRHRGYGTASHRAAIAEFGPSPIHRMSFKGMDLWATDPDLYRRLYAREDLLRAYGILPPLVDGGSGDGAKG